MSQRRLETFPDLPRPLGTSRTSYKKSYLFVKKVTCLKKNLEHGGDVGVRHGVTPMPFTPPYPWGIIQGRSTFFPAPLVCGMAIESWVHTYRD